MLNNKRIEKNCLFCNKVITPLISRVKRGDGKFCSQHCYGKYSYKIKSKSCFKTLSSQEYFFKQISIENHINNCWIWIGNCNKQGYGKLTSKKKTWMSHRFSWMIYNGQIPPGLCILHKCDNPPCCNPDHLFIGTHKDNSKDMVIKKRNRDDRGSKHPMHKLNEQQVLKIRESIENGEQQSKLAIQYNVGPMTISNIKHRKSWKHI